MKTRPNTQPASRGENPRRDQLSGVREMRAIEDWSTQNDDEFTPAEVFAYEIDQWAQRALSANGFGDF